MYFTCAGQVGASSEQKVTAALCAMAYAISQDAFDENVHMGEPTLWQSIKKFVQGVVDIYGEQYLRKPATSDLERLCSYRVNGAWGFPGMWGAWIAHICLGTLHVSLCLERAIPRQTRENLDYS